MQNQKTAFAIPPSVELSELKNLFFQLCSNKFDSQYQNRLTNRNINKNSDEFINIEKIKQNLLSAKNLKLNSIYLSGGEPLAHPDFNHILRMCLKISNTTVLTNGTMINDKKARFLRKIDDESQYETIYRINLDSINEYENDTIKGRGSFRKALVAIMSLIKYEFNPIISVVNYKNRKREEIFSEFRNYFSKKGFEMEEINLKIIPYFHADEQTQQEDDLDEYTKTKLDCYSSRVVCKSGVYSCAMLTDDFRARLGSSVDDCSLVNYLDCEKCSVCMKLGQKMQVNDWM